MVVIGLEIRHMLFEGTVSWGMLEDPVREGSGRFHGVV
jgi:hypothetical protein